MARGRDYRDARARMLAEATHCVHCGCEISDELPANYIRPTPPPGAPLCGEGHTGVGKATADHLITVADGGTDDERNLVPACLECNLKRGAKDPGWNDPVIPGYEDW